MKITKELFNRLPQLDRIEYSQTIEAITRPTTYMFIVVIILLAGRFILASFIGIIGLIYHYLLFKERERRLNEKYFNIQVKRNERGNKK